MTSTADNSGPRVLVVEDRAHLPRGHFPTRFAEVAEGLVDNGCVVEALTSNGWLHDGERPVPFVVRRYGWLARILYRAGEAFRATRGLHRFASALRTVALVRAARARCKQAGKPTPDVIVVSIGIDPLVAAAFAGRGRWLFYEFGGPGQALRSFEKRAARAEQRRRARGGRAVVAVPNDADRARWQEVAAFLDPVILPIAGVRPRMRLPNAKQQFGLSVDKPVALVFGTHHDDKDVGLVLRVFADLDDWRLIVAGTVADDLPARRGTRDAIVVGGYVDDATRTLVYSAADLVVLSFRPSFRRNSGVLADAISFGVPVACSDGCPPADAVRRYGLGTIFTAGDPDSLERAIRTAPARVDPPGLARAQADLSNRAVASRFLEALSEAHSTGSGGPA